MLARKTEDQKFTCPFCVSMDIKKLKDYPEIIKDLIDPLTIEKRMESVDIMRMVPYYKMCNDSTSDYFDFIMLIDTLPGSSGMGNTMNAIFVL